VATGAHACAVTVITEHNAVVEQACNVRSRALIEALYPRHLEAASTLTVHVAALAKHLDEARRGQWIRNDKSRSVDGINGRLVGVSVTDPLHGCKSLVIGDAWPVAMPDSRRRRVGGHRSPSRRIRASATVCSQALA